MPGWMVKPAELIEVIETQKTTVNDVKVTEMRPLTAIDRRLYNRLILNAWDRITDDVWHPISLREAMADHGKSSRLRESVMRLQSTFIELTVTHENGEQMREPVALLARARFSERRNGLMYYRFSNEMRSVISNSTTWAKLQTDVISTIESRYAMVLYEITQQHANLKLHRYRDFTVEEFRRLLGVPEGKLMEFKNLRARAIDPAVREVTAKGGQIITVTPIASEWKRVTKLRLAWAPKPRNLTLDLGPEPAPI